MMAFVMAEQWAFFGALLFSSLINAILFFKIIEVGFFDALGKEKPDPHHHHQKDEAPITMLIPILASAAACIGLGLATNRVITYFINPIMPM